MVTYACIAEREAGDAWGDVALRVAREYALRGGRTDRA